MIQKVLFLRLSALFSSICCCISSWVALKIVALSLRLHVCAEVCIHESEMWQCFFFFFNLLSSGHFPPCFDHLLLYPEGGTTTELYHNRDKYVFEFRQGHVTKNQPVAVPI